MSASLSPPRLARLRTSLGAWAAIAASLAFLAFAILASWPVSAVALAVAVGCGFVSALAFGRSPSRTAAPTNTQLQQLPPAIIATDHERDGEYVVRHGQADAECCYAAYAARRTTPTLSSPSGSLMQVQAPRFDLDECNTEAEREFIEALHLRAEVRGWYADGRRREDRVIVTIDVLDREFNCSLRTLRVDFNGSVMLAGPDETGQLASDLDADRSEVVSIRDCAPQVLADAAADWLEREMFRPIERCEWNRVEYYHRLWRYADTGEELVWSDSQNQKRRSLGIPSRVAPVMGPGA